MSEKFVRFEELFSIPLRNGVSYPSRLRGSGTAMVNMGEIFAYDRITDHDYEHVPLSASEQLAYLLNEGDLLFARQSLTYEGAGKCAIVGTAPYARTWESHLMRVRLNPDLAEPEYYFNYFRSHAGRNSIEAIIQQVAAAGIRGSDLRRLVVPNPPVSAQRAIAEVIRALDAKVESNSISIEKAGHLADSLFTQAVREVPNSTQRFCDVASVAGGGTPKTSEASYWNGPVLWATPTDITALKAPYLQSTSRTITEAGLASCASILHPAGSILMTSRATIGAFAIAEVPTAINQGFIVVNAHNPSLQLWLYHEMRSRVQEFISHANGATFLELSRGRFKNLNVRLPELETIREFDTQAAALHRLSAHLSTESSTLTALRDALLPRLMSGQITVRDAEKQIESTL